MNVIQSLSQSCINRFEELLSTLKGTEPRFLQLMPPTTIETQLGKLRIWCGNLGALQVGYSSLDYRLRESAIMRQNVSQLLHQLSTALEESASVASGERPPFDEQSMPSDVSEESADDDDTSNECPPTTELSMRVSSISEILKSLYRLSYQIRNSSLRSDSTKPSLIRAVDSETGINLFDALYEFDERHLTELFTLIRKGRPGDGISSDVLLERLTKSNVLRRKQFRYWERHARKLGVQVLPERRASSKEKPSTSEVPEDVKPQHAWQPEVAPQAEEQSHPSETNATPYDPALDDKTEKETIHSLASTALDADGKGIDVPKPPKEPAMGDPFTCPYCVVVCPPKQGRGKAWKSHVLQDLRPYVCTYDECNRASDLYQSRKAWVDHEEAVHRPSWRCRDHPDVLYASPAGFQNHLLQQHDRSLSGEELDDFTKISKLGRADDRKICPICFEQQPFPKGLTNHLANHLERIALFALPRTIPDDDRNLDQSQLSNLLNIDYDASSVSEHLKEYNEGPMGTVADTKYRPHGEILLSSIPEMSEPYSMLEHFERFFTALESHIDTNDQNLPGYDKFAFELAKDDAQRCLSATRRIINCRVGIAARENVEFLVQPLWDILKNTWRFLYKTMERFDKATQSPSEDQEKEITSVIGSLGGFGTVHDILEGVLQLLEGSIPFAIGLGKIEEHQEILTALSSFQQTSDVKEIHDFADTVEQAPDVMHMRGISEEPLTLDPRYRVYHARMFQPGEVLKALWPELVPDPHLETGEGNADPLGCNINVSFRRFLIVATDIGHCTCVPISTYGKKGLKKKGVHPTTHGMVCESTNRSPRLLKGEPDPGYPPIRVIIYENVENNVKVLFIGRVVGSDQDIVTEAVNACWEKKDKTMGRRKYNRSQGEESNETAS